LEAAIIVNYFSVVNEEQSPSTRLRKSKISSPLLQQEKKAGERRKPKKLSLSQNSRAGYP
jgi:hypothetical protein